MTSQPIRDPLADHLITPANSALAVIDYQPSQIGAVRSIDHDLLLKNVVSTVKVAKLFGVPIVHSTINVANGQGPTLTGLAEELADSPPTTGRRSAHERTSSFSRRSARPAAAS